MIDENRPSSSERPSDSVPCGFALRARRGLVLPYARESELCVPGRLHRSIDVRHKQIWVREVSGSLAFVLYFDGCAPTLRYQGIKRGFGLSSPGKAGLILFVVVAGLTLVAFAAASSFSEHQWSHGTATKP